MNFLNANSLFKGLVYCLNQKRKRIDEIMTNIGEMTDVGVILYK